MELKDKVVLVTGSSSGIGQAIAIACAKKGSKVIINYLKNKEGAEQTLKEVNKFSDGIILQADVTVKEQIDKLFSDSVKAFGNIDLLVNNAGGSNTGDWNDFEIWREQWEINFMSAVMVTMKYLSLLKDSKGRILNITSFYGNSTTGNPEYLQYSVAKAALNNFTKTIAKKVAPKVLVNAIAPGYVMTKGWDGTTEEEFDMAKGLTKIGRFITPEEIASAAVAVLENDAMTGEIVTVDGGISLMQVM